MREEFFISSLRKEGILMSDIFGFVFMDGMDDVVKIPSELSLDEMGQDGIMEMIRTLAKNSSSWEAVLQGRCAAMFFDEGKMHPVKINWKIR